MHPKALIGLVRSRLAYVKEWPEVVAKHDDDAEPQPERVFDLAPLLADQDRELSIGWAEVGRHLPFPIFAVAGTGYGVFIVSGADEGLYAYCYTSPIQMLVVHFTPAGWRFEGISRNAGEKPEFFAGDDPKVKQYAEAVATVLALVTEACDDTKHVVSYTLNRGERRSVARDIGGDDLLGNTVVHRVCLDMAEHARVVAQRGATVVPTPKRLHEVRSHWRHLRSGIVVRVRSHVRGKRGGVLLPRIYTPKPQRKELP